MMPGDDSGGGRLAEALSAFASGVTLVTVSDGRDDIGTTVSAFCPVSLGPPQVLVSLIAGSYPAEVLSRVSQFGVTVLAATQRALAGRFAAAGRPGARLLLDGVPHFRGAQSGALIPEGGLAALERLGDQRAARPEQLRGDSITYGSFPLDNIDFRAGSLSTSGGAGAAMGCAAT